jgi:hypothetical protein
MQSITWLPDWDAKIRQGIGAGRSVDKVAKDLGVSSTALANRMKVIGVKPANPKPDCATAAKLRFAKTVEYTPIALDRLSATPTLLTDAELLTILTAIDLAQQKLLNETRRRRHDAANQGALNFRERRVPRHPVATAELEAQS